MLPQDLRNNVTKIVVEYSVPYSLLIDHAKLPSAKIGDYIVEFIKKHDSTEFTIKINHKG